MDHQKYFFKWKKQMEHLQSTLADYIDRQMFCDVTLASEGEVFNAHQFVLSACSPYFENIFKNIPNNKHPIIFLKDVNSLEIKMLFDYMYKGQAVVSSDLMPAFLKTCERLQIQGLCNTNKNANSENNSSVKNTRIPLVNRRVKKNKQVILETGSANTLNQELRCRNNKQKTNFLEQHSDDNAQLTCENVPARQVVSIANTAVGQIRLLSHTEDNLTKEKKQGKENHCSPCKQTKYTDVRPDISTSKPLLSEENASLIFSFTTDDSQVISTEDQFIADSVSLYKTETTQVNIPEITIDNKNKDCVSPHCETINQNTVLASPPYSQESFIFSTDNLNTSNVQNPILTESLNLSSNSVVFQDTQQDIIEISDDGNNTINGNSEHFIADSLDVSEGMIVQLDERSQKHIATDNSQDLSQILHLENIPKTQGYESDESEITIRRKKKRTRRKSNSRDSIAFKTRALPTSLQGPSISKISTNSDDEGIGPASSKNLKSEALNRAKNMKIIIRKSKLL